MHDDKGDLMLLGGLEFLVIFSNEDFLRKKDFLTEKRVFFSFIF